MDSDVLKVLLATILPAVAIIYAFAAVVYFQHRYEDFLSRHPTIKDLRQEFACAFLIPVTFFLLWPLFLAARLIDQYLCKTGQTCCGLTFAKSPPQHQPSTGSSIDEGDLEAGLDSASSYPQKPSDGIVSAPPGYTEVMELRSLRS
jgi:hypothetical protein